MRHPRDKDDEDEDKEKRFLKLPGLRPAVKRWITADTWILMKVLSSMNDKVAVYTVIKK